MISQTVQALRRGRPLCLRALVHLDLAGLRHGAGGRFRALVRAAVDRIAAARRWSPREQFPQAVAFSSSSMQFAAMIGPAIGGFAYAALDDGIFLLLASLPLLRGNADAHREGAAHAAAKRRRLAAAEGVRRLGLCARQPHRARRDLARPVRGAARRRRPRCCRFLRAISCMSGPARSACCARARRSAA